MVKMIMHGCNGHMGQVISDLVEKDPDIEIVAGVDPANKRTHDYPVFPSLADCYVDADVIIDFAAAVAVDALLEYSEKNLIPVVLCTTGLSEEQLAKVNAAKVFGTAGYDIEVVEQHHRLKKDAPSGTALALADSINDALGNQYEYVYDRSGRSEQRPDKEIGISAVRGGTIVGVHDVIFAGTDEVITFNHTAYSKSVFAKGAIEAGKFLAGKPAGMYDMADVIDAK